nr:hypothetical protein BaRGS_002024 [Batillaria attramentaria]
MTAAILQAQSGPGGLEIGHLQVLTQMLGLDDRSLNILRVCECAKELNRLLEKFAAELKNGAPVTIQGAPTAESLLLSTVRALNNLAMDIKTQPQLEGSLPLLTDLLLSEGVSESVTLATLQPLTNMSSTPAYHGHYTRILHQIYGLLDTSHNPALRLQCLKVLVNLSLNADMVPHMLAAKAPECLMELIDINCDMDLLLRTVTFLANVMAIMQEKDLTSSSLPPDEKAASPETMYAALFALDRKDALRNKVYRLTRHQSEDVCYQASRLYKYITAAK